MVIFIILSLPGQLLVPALLVAWLGHIGSVRSLEAIGTSIVPVKQAVLVMEIRVAQVRILEILSRTIGLIVLLIHHSTLGTSMVYGRLMVLVIRLSIYRS